MAFRKVNRMSRRYDADRRVISKVLAGKGAFKPRHPDAGRHVEADISRQVLALIEGEKVVATYHTSTGAPGTPTIIGSFRVYLKTPGTNAKGMVHSSYFIRGYAIHGYIDVPAFNASHGCLRVPIPDAWRIFTWIRPAIASSPTRSVRGEMDARQTLLEELRRHALIVGEVTLTSGATAQYYVDAKRAILRPAGFLALAELVAGYAREWEATAVGGLTMGADAPACAALAGGADVKAFFVRKEAKAHGLQRRVEGPPLEQGERCLIVEDVVTSGGSAVQAIEAVRAGGHDVCGVVAVLDRLAGGGEAIVRAAAGAPTRRSPRSTSSIPIARTVIGTSGAPR